MVVYLLLRPPRQHLCGKAVWHLGPGHHHGIPICLRGHIHHTRRLQGAASRLRLAAAHLQTRLTPLLPPAAAAVRDPAGAAIPASAERARVGPEPAERLHAHQPALALPLQVRVVPRVAHRHRQAAVRVEDDGADQAAHGRRLLDRLPRPQLLAGHRDAVPPEPQRAGHVRGRVQHVHGHQQPRAARRRAARGRGPRLCQGRRGGAAHHALVSHAALGWRAQLYVPGDAPYFHGRHLVPLCYLALADCAQPSCKCHLPTSSPPLPLREHFI